MKVILRNSFFNYFASILAVLVFGFCNSIYSEIIPISATGFDDGIKTNKRKDRNEAEINAMQKAVEQAGVKIQSETLVHNGILEYQYIFSKVKSMLLPGYKIHDMGYDENGTYQVVLIGKVDTDKNFINKPERKEANADIVFKNTKIDLPQNKFINYKDENISHSKVDNTENLKKTVEIKTNSTYNGKSYNLDEQIFSKTKKNWIRRIRINTN